MNKKELIERMVQESVSFTNQCGIKDEFYSRLSIGEDRYEEQITKFILRRLEGIALTTADLKTNVQVYNKYVNDGEGTIKRRILGREYKYHGSSYKGTNDIISIKLERGVK